MAENNRSQESLGNQRENASSQQEQGSLEQNRGGRQEVGNQQSSQSDRMESQPGSLSGIGQDNQRISSDDAGVRGSDMGSTESL